MRAPRARASAATTTAAIPLMTSASDVPVEAASTTVAVVFAAVGAIESGVTAQPVRASVATRTAGSRSRRIRGVPARVGPRNARGPWARESCSGRLIDPGPDQPLRQYDDRATAGQRPDRRKNTGFVEGVFGSDAEAGVVASGGPPAEQPEESSASASQALAPRTHADCPPPESLTAANLRARPGARPSPSAAADREGFGERILPEGGCRDAAACMTREQRAPPIGGAVLTRVIRYRRRSIRGGGQQVCTGGPGGWGACVGRGASLQTIAASKHAWGERRRGGRESAPTQGPEAAPRRRAGGPRLPKGRRRLGMEAQPRVAHIKNRSMDASVYQVSRGLRSKSQRLAAPCFHRRPWKAKRSCQRNASRSGFTKSQGDRVQRRVGQRGRRIRQCARPQSEAWRGC
jgi:hypothetical protein